jgi:hypothetical protein
LVKIAPGQLYKRKVRLLRHVSATLLTGNQIPSELASTMLTVAELDPYSKINSIRQAVQQVRLGRHFVIDVITDSSTCRPSNGETQYVSLIARCFASLMRHLQNVLHDADMSIHDVPIIVDADVLPMPRLQYLNGSEQVRCPVMFRSALLISS